MPSVNAVDEITQVKLENKELAQIKQKGEFCTHATLKHVCLFTIFTSIYKNRQF